MVKVNVVEYLGYENMVMNEPMKIGRVQKDNKRGAIENKAIIFILCLFNQNIRVRWTEASVRKGIYIAWKLIYLLRTQGLCCNIGLIYNYGAKIKQ